ncbi:MAG: HNH endonuclease [Proteobacteria bacterium]|nr:HNH endonuclease [Pseudomonadota bacterium]
MNNHLHHIIPRCKGGSDDPSNLVSLSPYKHAYLHAVDFIKRFFFTTLPTGYRLHPRGFFHGMITS